MKNLSIMDLSNNQLFQLNFETKNVLYQIQTHSIHVDIPDYRC